MTPWKLLGAFILSTFSALAALALPPPRPTHYFYDLHVSKRGVLIVNHTDGVFVSEDEGQHWRQWLTEQVQIVNMESFGLIGVSASAIYRSTDDGITWTQTAPWRGSRPWPELSGGLSSDHNGKLYRCATPGGVEVSADFGATWLNWPRSPKQKVGCAKLQITPKLSYMDSRPRLISRDGGTNWVPMFKTTTDGFEFIAELVTVDKVFLSSTGTLYANAQHWKNYPMKDLNEEPSRGVYQSTDNGRHWTRLNLDTSTAQSPKALFLNESGLYFLCRDGRRLCVYKGTQVKELTEDPTWTNTSDKIVLGDNGHLYKVNMYDVFGWRQAEAKWEAYPLRGIRIGM